MANRRLVALYLRSRGVPYAVPGLAALVVLTGWDARWLDWVQGMVLVLVAVLAAALFAGGFATPSPELDATAPLPWWRWRAGHALAGLTVCALSLAAAAGGHHHGEIGLDDTVFAPAMVRNVLGLGGLALLTAVVAGAWLSWTLPFVYALVAWLVPPQASAWARVWQWPMLPADAELAWWPALGLCVTGLVLMVTRGAASSLEKVSA